ncbi:radical SAM family heme chaperone HemW [Constantimarinum furrinae]|uniref:Heme chaperone HemW n=1 Tax=Constantimarinum furrinae TaxID=2562285 RepID=A0A7G8PS56_9FLAO|nr:radical SAM family heme chaperone HemW [Constantimarinum furrinae]QNJ97172.1 coproporphyrinogen III oxidase [Constantimarinum furrinae]
MSGIYIHIPFCKQACHYCDFHFSTTLKNKEALVEAICKEIILRKDEVIDVVETIYFGGGTPSLLSSNEIDLLLNTVFENFNVSESPEITLEANPDDLNNDSILDLAKSGINRLSIGVQSFFEVDLNLMNRAHNASEAKECILLAGKHFDNISIDLIYGIPGMDTNRWVQNLQMAFDLNVPHLSCYALTVEPRTALEQFIRKGVVAPVDEEMAAQHFYKLLDMTAAAGYENYEFSNFGKPGYYARNNTAYWQGKPYLGVGPSAHSFDVRSRSWNVSNNAKYLAAIRQGILPLEREILSETDKFNEYIMTGLRTKWGVSLEKIEANFGIEKKEYLLQQAKPHLNSGKLKLENDTLSVSLKGKFFSDGIAADLFLVNLD